MLQQTDIFKKGKEWIIRIYDINGYVTDEEVKDLAWEKKIKKLKYLGDVADIDEIPVYNGISYRWDADGHSIEISNEPPGAWDGETKQDLYIYIYVDNKQITLGLPCKRTLRTLLAMLTREQTTNMVKV